MFQFRTQSGFSLVETLVAITILLIVVVGPMTIAANATRGTNFSSEQVIAYALAQEALEIVQKDRDDQLLPYFSVSGAPDDGWNGFVSQYSDCEAGELCGVWVSDVDIGLVDHGGRCDTNRNRCDVYFNTGADRQYYTQEIPATSYPQTIYRREVLVEETVAGQEVQVTAIVSWRTSGQLQEQQIEMTTYLFNVYGR